MGNHHSNSSSKKGSIQSYFRKIGQSFKKNSSRKAVSPNEIRQTQSQMVSLNQSVNQRALTPPPRTNYISTSCYVQNPSIQNSFYSGLRNPSDLNQSILSKQGYLGKINEEEQQESNKSINIHDLKKSARMLKKKQKQNIEQGQVKNKHIGDINQSINFVSDYTNLKSIEKRQNLFLPASSTLIVSGKAIEHMQQILKDISQVELEDTSIQNNANSVNNQSQKQTLEEKQQILQFRAQQSLEIFWQISQAEQKSQQKFEFISLKSIPKEKFLENEQIQQQQQQLQQQQYLMQQEELQQNQQQIQEDLIQNESPFYQVQLPQQQQSSYQVKPIQSQQQQVQQQFVQMNNTPQQLNSQFYQTQQIQLTTTPQQNIQSIGHQQQQQQKFLQNKPIAIQDPIYAQNNQNLYQDDPKINNVQPTQQYKSGKQQFYSQMNQQSNVAGKRVSISNQIQEDSNNSQYQSHTPKYQVEVQKEKLIKRGNDIVAHKSIKIFKNSKKGQQSQQNSQLMNKSQQKSLIGKGDKNTIISPIQSLKGSMVPKGCRHQQGEIFNENNLGLSQISQLYTDRHSKYQTSYLTHQQMEEEKSIDLSHLLLLDSSATQNYNISKMHNCSCNQSHIKYKVPKKYDNVKSHYSPSNIKRYLSQDHSNFSNNKKWLQPKTPTKLKDDAGSRNFWSKKPEPSPIKDKIQQKAVHELKNYQSTIQQFKKSMLMQASQNFNNKSSISLDRQYTPKQKNSLEFQDVQSIKMNEDFDKYLQEQPLVQSQIVREKDQQMLEKLNQLKIKNSELKGIYSDCQNLGQKLVRPEPISSRVSKIQQREQQDLFKASLLRQNSSQQQLKPSVRSISVEPFQNSKIELSFNGVKPQFSPTFQQQQQQQLMQQQQLNQKPNQNQEVTAQFNQSNNSNFEKRESNNSLETRSKDFNKQTTFGINQSQISNRVSKRDILENINKNNNVNQEIGIGTKFDIQQQGVQQIKNNQNINQQLDQIQLQQNNFSQEQKIREMEKQRQELLYSNN